MRFYTDVDELVFEDNAQYPASRPVELQQVMDRTAAGTIQVENYASPISRRTLNFNLMGYNDYQNLLNWFINVVQGMAETFNFEDERGDVFVVRFTTRTFSFPEVSYRRFSGSIDLEIVG